MNKIIKNILTKIENNGYEAYIIGGYVRDLLVGISSYDIDITTCATPKELLAIFPDASSKNLGGIDFKVGVYHFEITTYRSEKKYEGRKPIVYNYVSNLIEDLNRRDFTINTICMNKNGDIIDLLNGIKDLNDMTIRMIGNPIVRIEEDPLRILRGIRIATALNFNLEESLYKTIKEKKDLVKTLSSTRIKEELDKILLSNYPINGLKLLKELGIADILKIKNIDITPVKNLEGMYAEIDTEYNLPFTKEEKNNISTIKKIIKDGNITAETIYKHGLYLCRIAGVILNIKEQDITNIYKSLKIHERKDINLKSNDIINIGIDCSKISKIFKEIETKIIRNELKNKKGEIIKYIEYHKEEW